MLGDAPQKPPGKPAIHKCCTDSVQFIGVVPQGMASNSSSKRGSSDRSSSGCNIASSGGCNGGCVAMCHHRLWYQAQCLLQFGTSCEFISSFEKERTWQHESQQAIRENAGQPLSQKIWQAREEGANTNWILTDAIAAMTLTVLRNALSNGVIQCCLRFDCYTVGEVYFSFRLV